MPPGARQRKSLPGALLSVRRPWLRTGNYIAIGVIILVVFQLNSYQGQMPGAGVDEQFAQEYTSEAFDIDSISAWECCIRVGAIPTARPAQTFYDRRLDDAAVQVDSTSAPEFLL